MSLLHSAIPSLSIDKIVFKDLVDELIASFKIAWGDKAEILNDELHPCKYS